MRIVPSWIDNIGRWFLADTDRDRAKKFDTQNAYSLLTFLTTFSVAQGVVFVQAIQGKGSNWGWPVAIFVILSLLTLLGLSIIFRKEIRNNAAAWAYERGTIAFGRWTVVVSLILTSGLCLLAITGAIPGQRRHVKYESEYLPATPFYFSEKAESVSNIAPFERPSEKDAKRMGQWIQSISGLVDRAQEIKGKQGFMKRLLWIEQDATFKEPYESFILTVYLDKKYEAEDAFAFLVKDHDEQGYSRPIFRQLKPLPDSNDKDKINPRQFWVHEPNQDEKLVIFAVVTDKKGEVLAGFPARSFDVKLRVSSK